jgi:dATP pyrophosphohydrolase
MSRLVDVYPYRRNQNKVKLLIFKRTAEVIYPNQWRMIGGKAKKEEKLYEAALRELKEETGLVPLLFWTIPSANQFYDHSTDTIHHIPAFAAEIKSNSNIKLNHEHSEYKWISEDEIDNYISWPEQRRLMNYLVTILTKNEILEEWIIKSQK